jgi:hypothetical protein
MFLVIFFKIQPRGTGTGMTYFLVKRTKTDKIYQITTPTLHIKSVVSNSIAFSDIPKKPYTLARFEPESSDPQTDTVFTAPRRQGKHEKMLTIENLKHFIVLGGVVRWYRLRLPLRRLELWVVRSNPAGV